jgi:uncharacterized membrane protein YwzB
MTKEIIRIGMHFAMFIFAFWCLSGLNMGKYFLPGQAKRKAQPLLIMLSLALGYLAAQFCLAIMYQL